MTLTFFQAPNGNNILYYEGAAISNVSIITLYVPVRAPDRSFPRPARMAGKSVGLGGVSSTAAYFRKVWNFGRPWVIRAAE